ncbi:MAG: hypothetical protein K5798_03620 [Nitrosopumilus sp.]|uniref:hypothetical protein n=1 Tax=Nitrosopumilus sp. TaxID=2024843 RepID=UPI00242CFAA1|nr:hypothetical protein [Nitrosopumilus sp.]MCV0366341.1 hypothetical protein [Nitrosopumilus sp.]
MMPKEIRKQRMRKAKISFTVAGILLALSLIPWVQVPLEIQYLPQWIALVFGYGLPFLSQPFIISGIWNLAIRNRLSKNEKNENRIKQLEKRLNKVEESEFRNDSSFQDKNPHDSEIG